MTTFTITGIEKTSGTRIEISAAATEAEAIRMLDQAEECRDEFGMREFHHVRIEELAQAAQVETTEEVEADETLSQKIDRAGKLILAAIDGTTRGLVAGALAFCFGIC